MPIEWLLLSVPMAFVTLIVAFPSFLPPKDGLEIFMVGCIFFLMLFVWPIYLAVFPIWVLIAYMLGDLDKNYWLDEWPWKYLKGRTCR